MSSFSSYMDPTVAAAVKNFYFQGREGEQKEEERTEEGWGGWWGWGGEVGGG